MKNILITGASSGIGYELVRKFLEHDYCVYAVGRSTQSLENLNNKNLKVIQADITNDASRNKIYQAVGSIEIDLINSAGIARPQEVSNLEIADLREHFETNFFAPIQLTTHFLQHNQVGRVLNVSSGLAQSTSYGMFAYCASKAALHHATNCLNLESKNTIFANLRPGMVDTPMQEKLRNSTDVITDGGVYQLAKDANKLIAPAILAEFIYWVMQLPEAEFKKEDWSIYDEWHHKDWLKSNKLV